MIANFKNPSRRPGNALRVSPQLHADWSGYCLDGALSDSEGSHRVGQEPNDAPLRPENFQTFTNFRLLPQTRFSSLRGRAISVLYVAVPIVVKFAGGDLVDSWSVLYCGMRARSYFEKIRNRARRRNERDDGICASENESGDI